MFYVSDYEGKMPRPVIAPYYWTTIIAKSYKLGQGTADSNGLKMFLWNCPMYKNYESSDENLGPSSTAYGLNHYSFTDLSSSHGEHKGYVPFVLIKKPSEHLMLTETFAADRIDSGIYRANPNPDISGNGRVSNVHGGSANVLYSDGHIAPQKASELNTGTWATFATKEPWNYYLR
jgi:prepilin-type processing-associated H-X9-DG protein